jgi:hypothetical protein
MTVGAAIPWGTGGQASSVVSAWEFSCGRQRGGPVADSAELTAPSLRARFKELAEQWRRETGMLSSVSKIIKHPSYKAIIEMGRPALPLILHELRDRPNLWFPALQAIAKHSPVSPEQRSNPQLAREAWLTWGQKEGLIQ